MKIIMFWLGLAVMASPFAATAANPVPERPNVVMLMVDDLDSLTMRTMLVNGFLPNFKAYIGSQAVEFPQSFVSDALCAPSRATFLSGRYTHNHGVHSTGKWNGSVLAFDDSSTLPVWLRQAGYRTGHVGRYVNGYGYFSSRDPAALPAEREFWDRRLGPERRATLEATYVPPGWTEWYGLLDSWTYCTQNYALNENGYVVLYRDNGAAYMQGQPIVANTTIPKNYQTDVLTLKAMRFVDRNAGQPFFLSVAPLAPHIEECGLSNAIFGDTGPNLSFENYLSFFHSTIRPAPRHLAAAAALFPHARASIVAQPTFNEPDYEDKPLELRQNRSQLTAAHVDGVAKQFADRMASMLAVDHMIGKIAERLQAAGVLDNTVILFTSDNGWSYGQHRLSSKAMAYEESVRVPLFVRLPGKTVSPTPERCERTVLNTDLAPTIAQLAGAAVPAAVDGRSFVPLLAEPATPSWRKRFLIEHYISAWPHDANRATDHYSLSAVRTTGETSEAPHHLYVEYFSGMQLREGWFATKPAADDFGFPLVDPDGPNIMLSAAIDSEIYDKALDPFESENLLYNLPQRPNASSIEQNRDLLQQQLRQLVVCSGQSCREAEDM